MPGPQICENDWIQCLAFLSRPQLIRLARVHRLFHQLIQLYFPERPYALAKLAVWVDQDGDERQLWAGIAIFEWTKPYLAEQSQNKTYKITKWLGIHPFDSICDENLTAMEKCYRIVEIIRDGEHADCMQEEWDLYTDCGYKYANIEVAKFLHETTHLEEDRKFLLKKIHKTYNYCEDGPMSYVMPVRLCTQTQLFSADGIAHLLAHLDLLFIRVKLFFVLEEPPFWAKQSIIPSELNSNDDGNGNKEAASETKRNSAGNQEKIANLQFNHSSKSTQQFFNFLKQIFTANAYRNAKMASIFSKTRVCIKMAELSKLLLANSNIDQQIMNVFKQMAICCKNFTLYGFMCCLLQTNFHLWKALITNVNANGGLRIYMDYRINCNLNERKIWLRAELLPMIYGYNPQENPWRLLDITCPFIGQNWSKLLAVIIEDHLDGAIVNATTDAAFSNPNTNNITYQCRLQVSDNDFDYRWIGSLRKINSFMAKWQQFFNRTEEAETMTIGFDGQQSLFSEFILKQSAEKKGKEEEQQKHSLREQYFWRLMLAPTNSGCELNIFRYRTSEKTFHANLCEKNESVTKWWRRCFQLYMEQDGMEGLFEWPEVIENEATAIKIIENENEIAASWTNYILRKWQANWSAFFD